MKTMFKKALTVLGSVAMIGATVGAAAAAAYPSPFTSNTAIVVGANAAPSDSIAASSIASDLDSASVGSSLVGSTATVTSGDSFKFEKTSTKFHLGDSITAVITSSLDDKDLKEVLAKGTYVDDDNDEFDFKQNIAMASKTLSMFDDDDYKRDTPTVGLAYANGDAVLDYTLDFTDAPLWSDLETTDITILGKQYYVLGTSSNNTLTLLDSASSDVLTEGESTTLVVGGKSYVVSISFVSETEAKLTVNGENTNSMNERETYKLKDGSYLGLKDILYSQKDTGLSKVEFSIGSGKLVLQNNSEVQMNEEDIDNLDVTITNSGSGVTTALDTVVLSWDADDDMFVAKDSTITMPGFGAVSLSFGGMNFPASETIAIKADGDDNIVLQDFPTKEVKETITVLQSNTTDFNVIGRDSNNRIATAGPGLTLVYNGNNYHDYFVVSYMSGDEAESYLVRATNWDDSNYPTNKVDFDFKTDSGWENADTGVEVGDTVSIGQVDFVVATIGNESVKTVNLTASGSNNFNKLYSAEGMEVQLPWFANASNSTQMTLPGAIADTGINSTFMFTFSEENKDDTISAGDDIMVTFGLDSDSEVYVTTYTTSNADATAAEQGDSEIFEDWTYSDLATQILDNQGGDHESFTMVYHGGEVAADVYITSSDAVLSNNGEAGVMTVLDSAVSTVAGKNLVVVGGSAINSVAAELLGGAYSEAQFTSMTGIGAGQFLIQSFDRAGKTALLVAGYNAADTTKAATYLVNNAVDTAVGNKYKGTSATEASLMVA